MGWPPVALFRGLLLTTWHDLCHIRLVEALDNRTSFCGFVAYEPTPERTAFVQSRRELVKRGLDRVLFGTVTRQLKTKERAAGFWRPPAIVAPPANTREARERVLGEAAHHLSRPSFAHRLYPGRYGKSTRTSIAGRHHGQHYRGGNRGHPALCGTVSATDAAPQVADRRMGRVEPVAGLPERGGDGSEAAAEGSDRRQRGQPGGPAPCVEVAPVLAAGGLHASRHQRAIVAPALVLNYHRLWIVRQVPANAVPRHAPEWKG